MSREVQFVIRKGREVRVESPLDTGAPIFHNPSGFAAERAAGVRRQTRMAQFIVSIAMVLAGAYLISMLNPGVLALTLIWTWFAVFPLMARKTWRNLDRGTTIFENGVMTFFVAGTLVYRTFLPFHEISRTERFGNTLRLVSSDAVTWCNVSLDEIGGEGERVLSDMMTGRDWREPARPKLVLYSAQGPSQGEVVAPGRGDDL